MVAFKRFLLRCRANFKVSGVGKYGAGGVRYLAFYDFDLLGRDCDFSKQDDLWVGLGNSAQMEKIFEVDLTCAVAPVAQG